MKLKPILSAAALAIMAVPAQAACDASQMFTLNWNNQASESLSVAGSKVYTLTNGAGATRTVTVTFGGTTGNYLSYPDNNNITRQTPAVAPYSNGGMGGQQKTLTLGTDFAGFTTNIDSTTNVAVVTFTFNTPVTSIATKLFDVDYSAGQYRDWIKIVGRNGASTYAPVMDAPAGNNNGATTLRTTAGSWVNFGPTTVGGTTITSSEALGINGDATLTQNTGNVNASFAQPVTAIDIRYGNGPAASMTNVAGVQGIGIHNISFCPMPAVTVAKSSAPYVTTGANRFAIPGSDMSYSLTVTNSGGSPVDIGSLVLTDPLPANVTFYNGDYDAASPGMGPILVVAGSSGVTLPSSGIQFSTDGSTYSATAAAGYTSAVRYLRLTPTGSLAANSSVTFRFRARVN